MFIMIAIIASAIAYPIEYGEDSYYCEEGEALVVEDMGVFSDRWQCTDLDGVYCSTESCIVGSEINNNINNVYIEFSNEQIGVWI